MLECSWRVPTDLVWTRYDDSDDWAVFNPQSGDVHLVTASARFLWQTIESQKRIATRDLLSAVADHIDVAVDDDLIAATDQTLQFMDLAGLIAPIL